MNHTSVKPQTLMVNNIANHSNMNYSSVKPSTSKHKNADISLWGRVEI